ncbi:MAG: hypothetical protein E7426_07470 [Ruminococcaceae bacterium]|nr:hypothetical protein [Oscillospiraceae bacterium]
MGNEHGEWIMHGVGEDDSCRLRSAEDLTRYVDQVGFLPLFKNGISGFSVEERTLSRDWWSEDPAADPWLWRQIIAAGGQVAYGKFFDRKAGFISMRWLPYFANMRRDGYDFDALWEDGKAHHRAKKIMDLFADGEELFSWQVRQRAGFGGDGERNFEGTVTQLQMQTYLVIRDFHCRVNRRGESYGWPIAVYATPESRWGYDAVTAAYGESPEASRDRIRRHMLELWPGTDERQLRRMLG